VYFLGALLVIVGVFVLLSQLGILGLLLSTLNIPVIVLLALVLIVVGIVLIRGATLIGYSSNHQRKDRNELDYKDLTYEDKDSWDYGKRY
jgi:lipopolysaccharide export LptBFGC system permease protein LptF